jgi:hypothetical protein
MDNLNSSQFYKNNKKKDKKTDKLMKDINDENNTL